VTALVARFLTGSQAGRSQHLKPGRYVLGRGKDCDLPLHDNGASRRHAELVIDDVINIVDLGSANGTLLNGTKINGSATLATGATLRIGNTEILLAAEGGAGELRLVALDGPQRGTSWPLDGERTTIGRDGDCTLQIAESGVSGLHATLDFNQGKVHLRDLNSHNGTFLNGDKVDGSARLRAGDVVQVGPRSFEFIDGRSDDSDAVKIPGYHLIERIGAGSIGVTWRGKREHDLRAVAINILDADIAEDPAHRARILNAARAASRVQHPNVLEVLDSGVHEGRVYVVAPWAAHGSLADLISHGNDTPPAIIAALALDAARGLAAGEEAGIVHAGLRPGDILLDNDGVARIADLGVSGAFDGKLEAGSERPYYRSTEELDGHAADALSNQYHLGGLLYHALTGEPPFADSTARGVADAHRERRLPAIRDCNPTVPMGLERIVSRLMARRPAERYRDWAAVITDLEKAVREGAQAVIAEASHDSSIAETGAVKAALDAHQGRGRGGRALRKGRRGDQMPDGIKNLVIAAGVLLGLLFLLAFAQRFMR
jgi:pSer/pThr/pTyr-binding forkhead associated (FHA) protein